MDKRQAGGVRECVEGECAGHGESPVWVYERVYMYCDNTRLGTDFKRKVGHLRMGFLSIWVSCHFREYFPFHHDHGGLTAKGVDGDVFVILLSGDAREGAYR